MTIQQQLLAGFGFGPNLRYLRIASNNKKISDIAFKDQVIATVTQIENIYWDLVSAYEADAGERAIVSRSPSRPWTTPRSSSTRSHSGDGCHARRSRGLAAATRI